SCAKNAEAMVREMIAEGVYREDTDPAIVAWMLAGAYDRLARELIRERKRPNIESQILTAQRLFMLGLLTDDARAQLSRSKL
ncbi:MAG TPA: hypothetical protein VHM19_19990, partial [Polyangiales bacterium]|nr:hypothetical protein [Polyangiales bacterium]